MHMQINKGQLQGRYLFTNIVFVILMFKTLKKEFFVLSANRSLVGMLITIGDVIDVFPIDNVI